MAAAGLSLGFMVLWLRIGWLQIARHEHYEARAERNQEQRILVRPVRGQLLDRRGRPLARDLLTYSISAAPREMKDPRRTARDLAGVLALDARRLERAFAARPRFLWVARRVTPERGQAIAAWKRRGVYVSTETLREYPLGMAASEILGRCNLDHTGVEGLELQLDPVLRGRPGWSTLIRDGRGQAHALRRGLRRSPEHGHDVVLTIDADLQAIVETHLRRAVDTLQAVRGFATLLDPRSGEVLATATVPHLPAGKARNWNVTDVFEPGSTFKIVVVGAALEEGIASPGQVFEAAEDGALAVAPGAVFHDVHKEARFTFRDAVRWSSNIVMAKLSLMVGSERLYRYATALGFGSLTGVEFPGEVGGRLRSPAHWSARSCPTIAIGHELSVTPLQMALAYAAIANGGLLMQPMLVREIREPGATPRRFAPSAAHRVFREHTTRQVRDMLAAVVDSGTARAAQVPGLHVAGKTGTAQKYDPAVRTYGRGKYVSSFAGFAPAEDPALVGVVVIDEPRGKRYYGGEVAAPVFREILLDVLRLPDGGLDARTPVAGPPPAPAPVAVPDVQLLVRRAAERSLASLGLRARFEGEGPRVLYQEPAPGTATERGGHVTLWLASPRDSAGTCMPDLVGLPVREALRRLTRVAVRARIEGRGRVLRQDPPAGAALPGSKACRLWCAPSLARPSGTVNAVAAGFRAAP